VFHRDKKVSKLIKAVEKQNLTLFLAKLPSPQWEERFRGEEKNVLLLI
jgi:hypothetical protein